MKQIVSCVDGIETRNIPVRYHPLCINDALPGHVIIMIVVLNIVRVGREVFQADSNLARPLGLWNMLA